MAHLLMKLNSFSTRQPVIKRESTSLDYSTKDHSSRQASYSLHSYNSNPPRFDSKRFDISCCGSVKVSPLSKDCRKVLPESIESQAGFSPINRIHSNSDREKMVQDIAHLLQYIEELHSEMNRTKQNQAILCMQRKETTTSNNNEQIISGFNEQINALTKQVEQLKRENEQQALQEQQQIHSQTHKQEAIEMRANELLNQNQALQDIIEKLHQKHRLELEHAKSTAPKPPIQTQQTQKWQKESQELRFEVMRQREENSRLSALVANQSHEIETIQYQLLRKEGDLVDTQTKLKRFMHYEQEAAEFQSQLQSALKRIAQLEESNHKQHEEIRHLTSLHMHDPLLANWHKERQSFVNNVTALQCENEQLKQELMNRPKPVPPRDEKVLDLQNQNLVLMDIRELQDQKLSDYESVKTSSDNQLTTLKQKVSKYKQALKYTLKENQDLKSNLLNQKHVINFRSANGVNYLQPQRK